MAEDQDKGQEETSLQTENGLIDGGFLTLEKAMGVMEDLVICCCKNHGAHYLSFYYTTSELLQCTH